MTLSLSATADVSSAVWRIRFSTVPASPCSVWMICVDKLLISSGFSPLNSGLKPANRVLRSRAFWVWLSGITALGLSTASATPGIWLPCSMAR